MKKIPLTQNKFALVDDEDYKLVSKHKWHAHKIGGMCYAERNEIVGDKQKTLKMHRLILGLKRGDKRITDHRNGNGLDNRRSNLRVCTNAQNCRNQRKFNRAKGSQYKGVAYHNCKAKWAKPWSAHIIVDGNTFHLGRFDSEIEAAAAYDQAAKKYFGEFARLNLEPQKIKDDTIYRDLSDFIQEACVKCGLQFEEAKNYIFQQCEKFNINPEAIVWYINWAGPAHATYQDIAEKFGIQPMMISRQLNKLKQVFPDLFKFGPKVPDTERMLSLQQLSDTPSGLTELDQVKEKF